MQRMLVTATVIALVLVSLGIGAIAAHWPFWHRAWQWQTAAGGWPAQLAGPTFVLPPSASPWPLQLTVDARLAPRAGESATQLLLVGDAKGWVAGWSAPAVDVQALVDGRGLSIALLAPLFGALQQHTGRSVLDQPLRGLLDELHADLRGDITPRQLLQEMSGLAAGRFTPLNPFSRRAQLSSGPNFDRAALRTPLAWPPGSHFEPAPANAQLLSLVAGRLGGDGYASTLQRLLWSRSAAHEAVGLLDHRRGSIAAHCCLAASPMDWLRLGLLVASDGVIGTQRLLPQGYVAQMTLASPVHPGYGLGYGLIDVQGTTILVAETPGRRLSISPRSGRAVLWIGEGAAPRWQDELLLPGAFGPAESGSADNGKGG